jgi:hypothetical protein
LCAAVGHRFEARAQFGDKDVVVQAPVTIHVEQRDLGTWEDAGCRVWGLGLGFRTQDAGCRV